MRLRNIKNKEEILNNSKYIILNPKEYKGKWNNVFKNNTFLPSSFKYSANNLSPGPTSTPVK